MFVDTSVLVAILAREADADVMADRLEAASSRVTSPVVLLEAAMILSTLLRKDPRDVLVDIRSFLERAAIDVVPVTESTGDAAVEAFALYGKGRHPARLNFGDCLSYASAKEHRLPLFYKGDDFARTDLA